MLGGLDGEMMTRRVICASTKIPAITTQPQEAPHLAQAYRGGMSQAEGAEMSCA